MNFEHHTLKQIPDHCVKNKHAVHWGLHFRGIVQSSSGKNNLRCFCFPTIPSDLRTRLAGYAYTGSVHQKMPRQTGAQLRLTGQQQPGSLLCKCCPGLSIITAVMKTREQARRAVKLPSQPQPRGGEITTPLRLVLTVMGFFLYAPCFS